MHRALLALACSLLCTSSAHADTFTVSTTADGGTGSLREAVVAANARPGDDTILLPAGTYALSLAGTGDDAASSGDLDVTDTNGRLTIVGDGAAATIIDGLLAESVFEVLAGADLRLEDLTVTGGFGDGFRGGGAQVSGSITIDRCLFDGNQASFGGGIRLTSSSASATVLDSTFAHNDGYGGAIESQQGSVTLSNSTITGNTGGGGAIRLSNAGVVEVRNSTLYGNSSTALVVGGGSATATLYSSILAGNNGGEDDLGAGSYTTVSSLGYNLIGCTTELILEFTDQAGTPSGVLPAGLGPRVALSGGPGVHIPGETSLALDMGDNVDGLLVDQRGAARTIGAATDVGAAEREGIVCGDGLPEGTEICDDGDLDDADGCASDCTLCGVDGDLDGDLVCNAVDLCEGDDATGDSDLDGVCDALDVCDGDDVAGDADTDGICDDLDFRLDATTASPGAPTTFSVANATPGVQAIKERSFCHFAANGALHL